ncbi:hypothetical protein [Streptomyces sp. NPDC008122]|uniref:hypothetical protein n=1 Tax=Streptomyces sp. NPDC008122 TaxID=3364810 RepID=UPI0036E17AC3
MTGDAPRRAPGTELVPALVDRPADTLPGLVPGVGLLLYGAEDGTGWGRASAVAAALACGVLAVRGFRAGVRCEARRLVVRGFVWTRVIPRAAVTGVTGFPAVRWTAPGGRRRWAPVTAFVEVSEETGGTRSRKRSSTVSLRRWAARGQPPAEAGREAVARDAADGPDRRRAGGKPGCPGPGGRFRLPR